MIGHRAGRRRTSKINQRIFMTQKTTEEKYQHGLAVVDQVYGPGSREMMTPAKGVPFVDEIVSHVFGEIWGRPGLSVRDRRLLVIGATAMLGRDDLIEVQVKGGIVNGEFTDEQLDEIPLMMLFYAGAGNTTQTFKGIQAARASAKAAKKA
jgi:4-carboxymuconolactone decarboxylase